MDVTYIKGQVEVYGGLHISVAAIALCGLADALVQGGVQVIGAACEMPERYMHDVVVGTAASGKLFAKSIYVFHLFVIRDKFSDFDFTLNWESSI